MLVRTLLGCALGAGVVNYAGAAPIPVLSDSFDTYTTGTALSGQGGWTATAIVASPPPIQVAGPAGGNLYAQYGTSGQDEYKAFPTAVAHNDGDNIELAFKVNVSAATAAGDYFIHLSNPAGTTTNFYERIFVKSSGTGYVLGLLDTSGTGTATYGSTVFDFNTSHAVDVVWNFVPGGTNNDTFAMTVDGSPYLTHAWTSATLEPTAIASVNLRQGGATTAGTMQVDDITVSGVPEPTSLAFVGVALTGLCFRRRRTR
jgi:hypothetical protein